MHLDVSVSNQTLQVVEGGIVVKSYAISTSKFGLGSETGSNHTPLGNFEIREKVGDQAPEFTIFRSRREAGVWNPAEPAGEDFVLTRILWLAGVDPENANTFDRYIYIHGTNEEDKIGAPASHGCIRMRNADVIDLYDRVPRGTPVRIRR